MIAGGETDVEDSTTDRARLPHPAIRLRGPTLFGAKVAPI
jgi:hypothetical protein